ncbi:DMT family transporter [Planktotalea arctica]|uniref:DMT family transporter n=1 Tax=Planktotalea arctica TaxID=1481893 RepID=UPI00321946D1
MAQRDSSTLGIFFILIGMAAISVNDMLIKQLSGGYPLHQLVFTRSSIGILFSIVFLQLEGGWSLLKTSTPGLHLLRAMMIVISNMSFFAAIAVLPLAETTALFFAAPLMITLLSIPILGEKVGPMRLSAVLVGFVGVLIMQRPWQSLADTDVNRIVLLLPVLAALTYAINQVMTRKLGVSSKASALAIYIQVTFICVSSLFYLVAGDGRYAEGVENGAVVFLLRAWVWPEATDWPLLIGLGFMSAIVGYCLSQAYRVSSAATVAPFEYVGLPLAVFWGFVIFGELPDLAVTLGIILIMGAGLFVFLRERALARRITRPTNMRR